jgi:hypothetical protein
MSTVSGVSFARRVFAIAGWYGIIVMVPQYFLEARVGHDYPPAITHPENYYGFIGITLAWQLLFLVISRNPVRYRGAMLPAIFEKLSFFVAIIVLYVQGRVAPIMLAPISVDFVLALLFFASYRKTAALDSKE